MNFHISKRDNIRPAITSWNTEESLRSSAKYSMRQFINIVTEAAKPKVPFTKRLMVLVHPGSACGSADFNLGKSMANAGRDGLINDLNAWNDALLVLDGTLSDELDGYPALNSAINSAIARCSGQRIFADDDQTFDWVRKSVRKMMEMGVKKPSEVVVTGIWYWPNDEAGCVNAVYDALVTVGVEHVIMSDNAITDPAGDLDPDDEYEDSEEGSDDDA
jgi:hypothetical protein